MRSALLSCAVLFAACAAPSDQADPGSAPAPAPAPDGSDAIDTPDDDEPANPAAQDPTPAEDAAEDAASSAQPAAQLVPGCTATATLAGHPAWFFFTRPDKPCSGVVGRDRHALNELTRLIRSVPKGGRIDGHIFSITVPGVAQALLDAQTSGVEVRISTDGAVATSTASAKTDYLDKLVDKVYCTSANNTACIATADGAISHTKLFVFSTATAPDGKVANDVVWLGSANQTYSSGMSLYNNTVTVYGDTQLFTLLRGYLDDLYQRRRTSDYYDPTSGRGHFLAGAADVYASPETQTDLVVNRLDDVTPDDNCRVRVMQASVRDSRLDVVDRLVAMKAGHCDVWVVASTVEPKALAALSAAGIPVRQMPIHDKSFVVYGKYGASYEYRVYSGSHNLSSGSAHRFDEIFVKLAPETGTTHPVYDAYFTHFNDAYNVGKPLD